MANDTGPRTVILGKLRAILGLGISGSNKQPVVHSIDGGLIPERTPALQGFAQSTGEIAI
jgi:hypothetical protein